MFPPVEVCLGFYNESPKKALLMTPYRVSWRYVEINCANVCRDRVNDWDKSGARAPSRALSIPALIYSHLPSKRQKDYLCRLEKKGLFNE